MTKDFNFLPKWRNFAKYGHTAVLTHYGSQFMHKFLL